VASGHGVCRDIAATIVFGLKETENGTKDELRRRGKLNGSLNYDYQYLEYS
jgi:hypothetical protein